MRWGILEQLGPKSHGLALKNAKFDIEDPQIPYFLRQLVEQGSALLDARCQPEAVLRHPSAYLQIVNEGIQLSDGLRLGSCSDSRQQTFEWLRHSHEPNLRPAPGDARRAPGALGRTISCRQRREQTISRTG